MSQIIELEYNPYLPQLAVKINGIPPNDFSRLIQYSNEDIWIWADEIIDVLYAEVRDKFYLSFTGTNDDAEIIRYLCEKNEHCVGFKHNRYIINHPLTVRMGKLNQLIKNAGITAYQKSVIDAHFFVPPSLQEYLDDIQKLDINNLFCAVHVNLTGLQLPFKESKNDIFFILAESLELAQEYLKRYSNIKFLFILILGDKNKILDITNKAWFIETKSQDLFETIFKCFIEMPLLKSFRNCIRSIKGGNKIMKELNLIFCVEPLIHIGIEKEVEVGRSIGITSSLEPAIGEIPKLIYKVQNSKIASCDGFSLYGLHEGTSVLEVYKLGSKQPFFSKQITVIQRNRIQRLVLSEDELLLGNGDKKKISINYYPEDADNINQICWRSTNENILQVNSSGNITAVGYGNCRVICTAENVSAQCICTVKSYLEDINPSFILDENGKISMKTMEELPFTVELIPSDCVDGTLEMSSSNYDIVNVVNNTLYAKNAGEATITINNTSRRLSRTFEVVVSNNGKSQKQKKKGFFKSLFKY